MQKNVGSRYTLALALGALGVVYGDIGTSPLYSLRECFHGPHAIDVSKANVLGVLSLVFWSLILVVSIKYLAFVVRADNKGEGGILALLSLAFPERIAARGGRLSKIMIVLGLFGTALLYGDGMITPAISVLSAVEGLHVATSFFDPYVIPITVAILVALFSIQRFGTGRVGNIFGRVTLVWFLVLAALGIKGIVSAPGVLIAVNPFYAVQFFLLNGHQGFLVLGAVFLVVTGGEALYADMGHFGKSPMRLAWFSVVLPALLLNYFGQGALLLRNPLAAENPFFLLAPKWSIYPLVMLATSATVIASQALISGAFSLTMQAVQLGYFPRLKIEHTSSMEKGQIYIKHVNWFLMIACIGLVIGFGSSSNLAAAYGIAVTITMIITTILFFFAAQRLWKWTPLKTAFICVPALALELAFFGANIFKIANGGWFPLVVGVIIFTLLTTWKTGRRVLGERLKRSTVPFATFTNSTTATEAKRVRGTAVYLSGRAGTVPMSLLHNLRHNKVLHERIVFLTVLTHENGRVDESERLEVEPLGNGFYRVIGHFGFMEDPNVPELLEQCHEKGLDLRRTELSYFLSKETLIPTPAPGMAMWREKIFAVMSRNATSAASFFKLPPNKVVELGMQIEI
ncbi:MAG TPA: potassium transporter Kup [Verrucomicrobiae bacterium]|nr:potassium transporter Kup [Verrucomicrobiae bacterium]